MAAQTETVRIEKETVDKVREIVKATKQSIGGFITLEINKVVDRKLKSKKQ